MSQVKHPYYILIENLSKYSKVLKKEDIEQLAENSFAIKDKEFDKLAFFNNVIKETGIKPILHEYIGSKCADPTKCFKPWDVYGFDNVLFYFKNKEY